MRRLLQRLVASLLLLLLELLGQISCHGFVRAGLIKMMLRSATARPIHNQGITVMGLMALFGITVRTSAAAAAAALGSFAPLLPAGPPTVRPGPVTFGFALAGIEALVAGVGAASRVRPAPWKLSSFDDLPQRLPMVVEEGVGLANGR